MGTIAHDELNRVHQIWDTRLIFATYSDLKNNVGSKLTADTVGLIARVTADGSLWEHVQFTPCIKIRLIAGQDVTREEELIYVDRDNGNDTTGNGTSAYPFKSLHCLDNLPKLKHDFKIRMAASDYYDYFPEFIDENDIGDGRLIIDASGETYPVVAGPFTIGTVNGVGEPFDFYETATDITITPNPGWTPNEFYPRFIQVTSGFWNGYILPIFKHNDDTIRIGSDWYGFAPGDEFNIVRPPVKITVPYGVTIRGNVSSHSYYQSLGSKDAPFTPSFLMAGVELRTNSATQLLMPIKLESINCVFSFTTLLNEYYQGGNDVGVIDAYRSSISAQQIPATFDNSVLDDWYTYPYWIAMHENEPHHEGYPDIDLRGSFASNICCRGGVGLSFRSPIIDGESSVIYSLCGNLTKYSNFNCSASSIFIEQVAYPAPSQGPGISVLTGARFKLDGVYIEKCKEPIVIRDGGYVLASWLKGNAANITGPYALKIDRCSKFIIISASNVTILGTTGAVDFVYSNTQHVNWPASGYANRLTDGAGSHVFAE